MNVDGYTYIQRSNILSKKTNKPVFGMHHIKSDQQFTSKNGICQVPAFILFKEVKPASRSFLLNEKSCLSQMSNQQKRLASSSTSVVQNLGPFFAQSEIKNPLLQQVQQRGGTPRQPNANSTAPIISTFSSCQRERPTFDELDRFHVISILNSPPVSKQLMNSHLKSNVVQSVVGEEGGRWEFQELRDRLAQAEKYIQQIFQSGILNQQQPKDKQMGMIEMLQKKFQDLEIRQDQVEFNQKELKFSIKEMQKEDSISKVQGQLQDLQQNTFNILQQLKNTGITGLSESNLNLQSELKRHSEIIFQKLTLDLKSSPPLREQINKFEQFNREINTYLENRHNPKQNDMLVQSLNQSDIENLENYDLFDSCRRRIIDQQNENCKQFDIYDNSKHQEILSKSIEMNTNQKIKQQYRCQMSAISEQQMEESCIEPFNNGKTKNFTELVDEQGYLIDQNGQYLKDPQGNQIRLTSEQLEWLRDRNMLEEVL